MTPIAELLNAETITEQNTKHSMKFKKPGPNLLRISKSVTVPNSSLKKKKSVQESCDIPIWLSISLLFQFREKKK